MPAQPGAWFSGWSSLLAVISDQTRHHRSFSTVNTCSYTVHVTHVYHSAALHSFLPFRPSPGVHLPSAWSSAFTTSPWGAAGYKLSVFLFFKVFVSPSFQKILMLDITCEAGRCFPTLKLSLRGSLFPIYRCRELAAALACHPVEGHFPSLANFKIFSLFVWVFLPLWYVLSLFTQLWICWNFWICLRSVLENSPQILPLLCPVLSPIFLEL